METTDLESWHSAVYVKAACMMIMQLYDEMAEISVKHPRLEDELRTFQIIVKTGTEHLHNEVSPEMPISYGSVPGCDWTHLIVEDDDTGSRYIAPVKVGETIYPDQTNHYQRTVVYRPGAKNLKEITLEEGIALLGWKLQWSRDEHKQLRREQSEKLDEWFGEQAEADPPGSESGWWLRTYRERTSE